MVAERAGLVASRRKASRMTANCVFLQDSDPSIIYAKSNYLLYVCLSSFLSRRAVKRQ